MTPGTTNDQREGKRPPTEGQPAAEPFHGTQTAASEGRAVSGGSAPTVEQALYAILFMLALGTRLFSLGDLNLVSPLEAAQIWPAWLDHSAGMLEDSGLPDPRPPSSPLLYTIQRALFLVTGGGSGFWARFPSACAGAGLVLAAWGLRRRVGRGGALIAAVLLALDPWLLSFSRLADGSTLSVLTCVLLLAGLFDDENEGSHINRLAVTGGLFLISGPLAWLLLPIVLYAFYLLRGSQLAALLQVKGRQAALICAGTAVVGSTGLFSNLAGLSAIGESVGTAVAHLVGWSGTTGALLGDHNYTVTWALLRLLVDEPFLLLFGGAGVAIALHRTVFFASGQAGQVGKEGEVVETGRRAVLDAMWLKVLGAGAAWGILLILLPGRTPVTLLVTGLPLLLLAAGTASHLLQMAPVGILFRDSARMPAFATMGILLVTAFFWTGTISLSFRDGSLDSRLVTFYLLIPALGAFFVWWSGYGASVHVFGFLTLVAFFLAQVSGSWMLNLRPEYGHSRTLFAESGDNGMVMLAEDIARLSSFRTGDPTEAPVYLQVEYSHLPFFYWHLREMGDLRWHPGIDLTGVEAEALVVSRGTPGNREEWDLLPAGFVGSSYSVTQRWLPTEFESTGALIRWMLYRERRQVPGSVPVRQEVELWVIREK